MQYVPNRKYVVYKDTEKKKLHMREKRTVEKVPVSHKRISRFLQEQNKIFASFIKATREFPLD